MRRTAHALFLALSSLALVGCDMLGIETPSQLAAKEQAEAHAIGSACRHAMRSVELCFRSNPTAVKSAVFNGWKEMDAYMRENQIVGMPSPEEPPAPAQPAPAPAPEADAKASADEEPHAPADKKAHKS